MSAKKRKRLDDIVKYEIQKYEQRKALIFFEAAAGEIARVFPRKKAMEILESYLDELSET